MNKKEKNINIVVFGIIGIVAGALLSNKDSIAILKRKCKTFTEGCKSNIKFLIKGINIDNDFDLGGEWNE